MVVASFRGRKYKTMSLRRTQHSRTLNKGQRLTGMWDAREVAQKSRTPKRRGKTLSGLSYTTTPCG